MSNPKEYYSELQKDLVRNYALFYAMGELIGDEYIQEKYIKEIAKLYQKEFNIIMLNNSMNIAFNNIAEKYDVVIDRNNFNTQLSKLINSSI